MYVKYNMQLNLRYLLYRNMRSECRHLSVCHRRSPFYRITAQCCFACASAALCFRARSSPFAATAAAARDERAAMGGATCVSLCRYYMCVHCRCNIHLNSALGFIRISQFNSIALVLMGDPNCKQRPRAKTST